MFKSLLRASISSVPWRLRSSIKRIPLVAPLQRVLLEKFLQGSEFIHRVDAGPAMGLHYPVKLPQDKGIWTGLYELEFSEKLAGAVRRGDVCLDIGAWRGFFSGVLALAGARKVYAFEPLPANCLQIRKLMELNPCLPIELFESAVGAQNSTLEFCVMGETSMGKFRSSTFQPQQSGDTRFPVQVLALDNLIEAGRIEHPQVVKIDVEGAEALVLRGAKRLLSDAKPKLFLEVHSHALARECYDLLESQSYTVNVLETSRPPDFASEPEVCHFHAESFPL